MEVNEIESDGNKPVVPAPVVGTEHYSGGIRAFPKTGIIVLLKPGS